MKYLTRFYCLCLAVTLINCGIDSAPKKSSTGLTDLSASPDRASVDQIHSIDTQVEILKQQVWENLQKVAGTTKDYTTTVKLSIGNGNIINTQCKITFPESSWAIASVLVDDYKDVLKKTSIKVFEVIYRLITDNSVLATEITISGLWRPWLGSHVHIEGRGIDIRDIRGTGGSGVIFNYNTNSTENSFGKNVRTVLTDHFPIVSQYLSPWYICNPSTTYLPNARTSSLEKGHLDHLHLTLTE